ncbi:TspO/MBR family protein [Rhodococcus triatomae]|nr:TspO and MBR-like protein [Rhodococcus triatomae BKS 15-14]
MTESMPRTRGPLTTVLMAAGPPVAAAVIGAAGSRRAPQVYDRLRRPGWAPPASAFGPVWTILYIGIGVTGWRMARHPTPARTWALHGAQLICNAAWSPTFFGLRNRRASLTLTACLDALVAAEIADLARRDRVAAGLLVPYLGWSLFATALTAAVSDPDRVG